MFMMARVLGLVLLCSLLVRPALAGGGGDGSLSLLGKVARASPRQDEGPPFDRELARALTKAGAKEPGLEHAVRGGLAAFLEAFKPDPKVKSPRWKVLKASDVDATGAAVLVSGRGWMLAGFPLDCELLVDLRGGEVVDLPRVKITIAATDLSTEDTRIGFASPGAEIAVPVDPNTSRKRLNEGFASTGFNPKVGPTREAVACTTPADPPGQLLIDSTKKDKVWTAGGLLAKDGAVAYKQRIVVYEGSIPRAFRGTIEGKVEDGVGAKFKDAIAKVADAVPGRFTFAVESVELDRGALVVAGHASREASGEKGSPTAKEPPAGKTEPGGETSQR